MNMILNLAASEHALAVAAMVPGRIYLNPFCLPIVRDLQPRSFTKIAFTERLFEVSWLPPISYARVVSYTIYWCKSEDNRDRPYQVRILF